MVERGGGGEESEGWWSLSRGEYKGKDNERRGQKFASNLPLGFCLRDKWNGGMRYGIVAYRKGRPALAVWANQRALPLFGGVSMATIYSSGYTWLIEYDLFIVYRIVYYTILYPRYYSIITLETESHARQEWFRKRLMDRGGYIATPRFAAEEQWDYLILRTRGTVCGVCQQRLDVPVKQVGRVCRSLPPRLEQQW